MSVSAKHSSESLIKRGAMRRDMWLRKAGKLGLYINPIFAYFFLWAPIVILVLFSFNTTRSVATFEGFTLQWYENILNDVVGAEAAFSTEQMLKSLRNSLIVSTSATVLSTIFGTMVALALVRGDFPRQKVLERAAVSAGSHPGNYAGDFAGCLFQYAVSVVGRPQRAANFPRFSYDYHRACGV